MSGTFLKRFESVLARKQRVHIGQVVAGTCLIAVLSFGSITAADYAWELDQPTRFVLIGTMAAIVIAFGVHSIWRTSMVFGRPATAADIERAFPQLGQSVRTTVQFASRQQLELQTEGIAANLVFALAEQTHHKALPLTIEDVIPAKRLWLLVGGLAVGLLIVLGLSSADWEWRNAAQRALLNDIAYRELAVEPGNQTVDEGMDAHIEVALIGRTNRRVVVLSRSAEKPDEEWTERKLDAVDGSKAVAANAFARPRQAFRANLVGLRKPMEYRVTAGELASPIYRIDIRRPLQIEEIKVELTAPAYTGLPVSLVMDGNLNALQGTVASIHIQFDKPVKSAEIVLAPRKKPRDESDPNEPEILPLSMSGLTGTLEYTLSEDRNYSIVAEAMDGTHLPETRYRIRVREDQPPLLSFEEPKDAIEVHTLAEIPMRIRVRDDYGISKAGVIFQINNEQEIPLIAQDFAVVAAAAAEAEQTGKISPTTQAALEKVLPLEIFELTQKDSVMYHAYVEDNRPDNPQRTETEIRYIDIRPFKREYSVIDPDPQNGMGMGGGLKSLEEMIRMQRNALNRTVTIEKRAAAGRKLEANTIDELMKFETDLAQNVADTAAGLEARGFDDTELLHQAETAMRAAVDSLSVAKWENATLQMKDALKYLIEQRERVRAFILKNPDAATLAQLRQFDQLQAQKLRRPKTDKEEARELIRRLEQLMGEEDAIVEGLAEETSESASLARETTKSQQPVEPTDLDKNTPQ